MKANLFLATIALLAGALIGYAFYAAGAGTLQVAVSGILCTLFLVAGMSLSVEGFPRTTILVRTATLVFFFAFLLLNILLTVVHIGQSAYIIINGLLTLAAAVIVYLILRSKQ